jgi:WD40 repeat protein
MGTVAGDVVRFSVSDHSYVKIKTSHTLPVSGIHFSEDLTHLYVTSLDCTISKWQVKNEISSENGKDESGVK